MVGAGLTAYCMHSTGWIMILTQRGRRSVGLTPACRWGGEGVIRIDSSLLLGGGGGGGEEVSAYHNNYYDGNICTFIVQGNLHVGTICMKGRSAVQCMHKIPW